MKRLNFTLLFAIAFTFVLGACSGDGDNAGYSEKPFSVSPVKLEFEADAASASVTVDTKEKWDATPSDNWITLSKGSGTASRQLTVRVGSNTTYEDRTATITVTCGTRSAQIKVTQHARKAILLSAGETQLGHTEQTFSVDVESNVDYDVQIEQGVQWIKRIDVKALTRKTYNFSVEANPSTEPRNAKIIFQQKGGTLKQELEIRQNGSPRTLKVTHSAATFTLPAFTGVQISGSVDWGDEQTEAYAEHLRHTYGVQGSHTVTIETMNATGFKLETLKEVSAIDLSKF